MQHIFISYVNEDKDIVGKICSSLDAYGVRVWLDKEQLRPGVRWRDAVRDAIRDGAFFLACFSSAYSSRLRTFMNEEITVAIEELRLRVTTKSWFIPVLLDGSEVPDRSIGGGETLRDLQWVNLYDDWNAGIGRILIAVDPESSKVHDLICGLSNSSIRVRIRSADELGKLGSLAAPAIDSLVDSLKQSNDTLRAVAADSLGRIAPGRRKDIVDALQAVLRAQEYYSSRHASSALARFGAAGVPPLLEALSFKGYGVAHHASCALSSISDPEAAPLLIEAMLQSLRSGRDCKLLKIGEFSAHSGLHVAEHVATALERIGDETCCRAPRQSVSAVSEFSRIVRDPVKSPAVESGREWGVGVSGGVKWIPLSRPRSSK